RAFDVEAAAVQRQVQVAGPGFAARGDVRAALERAPAQGAGERGHGERGVEAAFGQRASARGQRAVDVTVPAGGEIARVEAVEGGVEVPVQRGLPAEVAARVERAGRRGRAQRADRHAAVAAAPVEGDRGPFAVAGDIGVADGGP